MTKPKPLKHPEFLKLPDADIAAALRHAASIVDEATAEMRKRGYNVIRAGGVKITKTVSETVEL